MHDKHIDNQERLLRSLGPLVSEDDKQVAARFAEALGAALLSYDPANALWRLSDGELYSMTAMHTFLEN